MRGQRWRSRAVAAMVGAALVGAALLASCAGSVHRPPAASVLPSASPTDASGRRASRPAELPSASAPVTSKGASSSPAGSAYYLSIGDSYAAGWQPVPGKVIGHTTTNGFAYQLAARTTVGGRRLDLENFGCAGATTSTLLSQDGCLPFLLGPGATAYPRETQTQAALAFIAAHRRDIALVTVSISGNDVTSCRKAVDLDACLKPALATVKSNLLTFLRQLRAAAGPAVTIVGLTYPDVLLGEWVRGDSAARALAKKSVAAFRDDLNPTLAAAYRSVGAMFVDVTAAAGAYIPWSRTTELDPYGTLPVAVARVCRLTYYCDTGDIHPRTNGYRLIADLIAATLRGK